MGRKGRTRLRKLTEELAHSHPDVENASELIAGGRVLVGGFPVTNPASLVRVGVPIEVRTPRSLRGEAKLRAALNAFRVQVAGRVALDLGASAGGFTRALLDAGAARVYAVDAGYGQLLGSLRQDPRVVNLERTNLGVLDTRLVPETVELITCDLSYLSIAAAVGQLDAVRIEAGADLIALVKPMFELGLGTPPVDGATLAVAVEHARRGLETAGWHLRGSIRSPVRGRRGAIEFLVHAARGGRAEACPSRQTAIACRRSLRRTT